MIPVVAGGRRLLDTERIDGLIEKIAPARFEYVSILAGGNCSANCYFCVGRNLRAPQSAACGPDAPGFIHAVAGRVTPYLSLSGLNSDPTLLPNVIDLIKQGQDHGFEVALHTNGFGLDSTPYLLADKVTISHHTFDEESFERIMGRPTPLHRRVMDRIAELGPSGKLKLSATYLPENAAEITAGRWFAEARRLGVRRAVIRRYTKATEPPVLPASAAFTGWFHGQPIYRIDGMEVTVWDFATANVALPALYYWPDGRVETSCAWEEVTIH